MCPTGNKSRTTFFPVLFFGAGRASIIKTKRERLQVEKRVYISSSILLNLEKRCPDLLPIFLRLFFSNPRRENCI
jgi:hypothetical protein